MKDKSLTRQAEYLIDEVFRSIFEKHTETVEKEPACHCTARPGQILIFPISFGGEDAYELPDYPPPHFTTWEMLAQETIEDLDVTSKEELVGNLKAIIKDAEGFIKTLRDYLETLKPE